MINIDTPLEATGIMQQLRKEDKSIGLVPTMGALHEGHRSLIARAREENDYVVVTIFLNPAQFSEDEDLDKYPRPLSDDLKLCEAEGVDMVFVPEADTLYQSGHSSWVEVGELTQKLEGMTRPGHFRGVTTVVAKLFNIFMPDRAYFGQKDLQQLVILRHMVKDLNYPIEIIACPIVRDEDGVALSSRNAYLTPEERAAAQCLAKAIFTFRTEYQNGERSVHTLLELVAEAIIIEPLATLDYAAIVELETLSDIAEITENVDIALTLAAWFGNTRLIDNTVIEAAK